MTAMTDQAAPARTPETRTLDANGRRYVELLKKTLTYSLWEDPGLPLSVRAYKRGPLRRAATRWLEAALDRAGLRLLEKVDAQAQREGRKWALHAHSMIGLARMENLQRCVERVIVDGVPGDLVETGVWRGGACIFMRGLLAAWDERERRVFVADSFAGLPPPDAERFPADAGDRHHRKDFLAVSQEEVEANFRAFDLLDAQVVFARGWFRDTLPGLATDRIAVLRLDGDLYESTLEALESLYPRLSPGGFCIVDDYALPPCARAVHDYREREGITEPIERIDWSGAFWRRSGAPGPG